MTSFRPLVACLSVAVGALSSASAEARDINYEAARLERRLPAVRTTTPIVVDGVLDEAAWRDAPVATNFIQNEPKEGEPASEETEVRVVYDEHFIFIGAFAHDSEPGAMVVNDLKKDYPGTASDGFGFVLDTFHDERNGYEFLVNPLGGRWDAQMVNEGREVNQDWDGIWMVKTRIVETGWYAEIAIPFRTLRFGSTNPQTWGINFLRRLRRKNEDSFWSPIPRMYRINRVSLAGTLEGLQGIRPGSDLRLKPYALGSAAWQGTGDALGDFDGGFDVKYGVASGLTWDFTVNTDFSQVEADEQQVNLTRFNLFFPEKRDFFLENSGVFQFGPGSNRPTGGGGGGAAPGGGGGGGGRPNAVQNDAILFFSRRLGLSDAGLELPILAGTRLTGRTGRYTIGALNIQQRDRPGSPATNFTALRLRRDILRNSDVGVMVLNKDETGPRHNRVVGADLNLRFFQNLNVNSFAAKTFSPDAVVGGRGEDTMVRAGANYDGRRWNLRGSFISIGDRFNDEMGFVPRTGINKAFGYVGTHIRPKKVSGWLRDIHPHWQMEYVRRRHGGLDSRYVDWHLPFSLQNSTLIEIGANPTTENLVAPFTINSRRQIAIAPGRYDFNEYFVLVNPNASAPLSFSGRWAIGEFYDGYKHTYSIGGTSRVNEQFNVSLTLARNVIDLPAGAFTTNLVTSRVNYNFSTRMFLNALLQYNTDAQQWSSNIRFNVIHRPLSDFFLVYNERRNSRGGDLIDRALVAKMTYMVAF